ncbi:transporter [Stenotrophomonas sp. SY1]|uniref:SphA family protein n=1 Tax=Stenotrophomonas sp. SY1 TaxID=477235 RepID=UPI001E400E87|nr:transporter [Stenotrophomonas sp. SY1]MCD9085332.1 transporter [Stenotrophomonas sp. SY1]
MAASDRIGSPACRQRKLASLVLGMLGIALAGPAIATEGAMGRSITGMQITSYAGVIPPDPGMQWSLSYIQYDGKIGTSRAAPVAGQVSFGLEADVSLVAATGVYVWPTKAGRWNFASMLTVPYIDAEATADLEGPLGARRQAKDHASNLFDVYFAPVIAGFHINEVQHLSFGVYVYAPTAEYDPTQLANPGMNVWTFSPAVGYTHLFQKGTLEFSVLGATDWYTRNDDTDYKNGVVARVDALVVKRTASGWGFGAAGGWIQQLQDDKGDTADRLDGFKGRSFGLGPVLTYGKKWSGGEHLDVSLRYVSEFSVKNRFEGDPVSLTISAGF